MDGQQKLKILFIINPGSGVKKFDWPVLITEFFKPLEHEIELFELPDPCDAEHITQKISQYKPDRVIAVGGDGTVNLLAKCLISTGIPLGILPAGSANGMAAEFSIPNDPQKAIDICLNGSIKEIHLVKVNGELCIHLSDLGFNAFVVKKFKSYKRRGMWSYGRAAWKVLWNQPLMHVSIKTDKEEMRRYAKMLVIANATRYGSGAVINPAGKLDDELFEVILVKKISFTESLKMFLTHGEYNSAKTEVLHTSSLKVQTRRFYHFQVDGEYLGKTNKVEAEILLKAIKVIVPAETGNTE